MSNLLLYRKQVQLTQKELADKAGVSQQQVSLLEGGRRNPERTALNDCRSLVNALAAAGAANDAGEPVTLDDVFPARDSITA